MTALNRETEPRPKVKPKVDLTHLFIRKVRPTDRKMIYWDERTALGLKVLPSGSKSYLVAYRHAGRLRWFHIDKTDKIGLKEARETASRIRARAAAGEDPQANKMEARKGDTFEQLAERYVEERAKKRNKSWAQAEFLVRRYLLPDLGGRKAKSITRDNVRRIFNGISRDRPILANQILAACSVIFSWGIKQGYLEIEANPCINIERNATHEKERTLSKTELRAVWPALDGPVGDQLRLVLLTAQRPGEVQHMRWEHVADGVWCMPGEPEPDTGWLGTKNALPHDVPLSPAAAAILEDLGPRDRGFVFPGARPERPTGRVSTRVIWDELGIPRFTPHDLRRTAATMMAAMEIDRITLSRILNHKEGGVSRIYDRHSYARQKAAALEAWADRLHEIVTGEAAPSKVVRIAG